MPKYTININGNERQVDCLEDTPLLWVIRDMIGLTGTKYGCGKALCGACTVHLDGKPVRSCSVSAAVLSDQAKITTIEGISNGNLHAVQQAWIEEDVPQCGYCQSGQIMSAVALLDSNANPTDEEIERHMNGNLCRCGTYTRIKKAIKRAAKELA
ncbi:MAG: (2Fe-2S)-binding protein [Cytophagales bacterium]|nr:(2Fe-2S)-binding protein [Cytophagales bacterium]